ncbi:MAG: hypothetical protein JSS61_01350 [Verrucomicrobia bacterium]|nr:hypothetical protein [Verrucomicrobiota bacterium]
MASISSETIPKLTQFPVEVTGPILRALLYEANTSRPEDREMIRNLFLAILGSRKDVLIGALSFYLIEDWKVICESQNPVLSEAAKQIQGRNHLEKMEKLFHLVTGPIRKFPPLLPTCPRQFLSILEERGVYNWDGLYSVTRYGMTFSLSYWPLIKARMSQCSSSKVEVVFRQKTDSPRLRSYNVYVFDREGCEEKIDKLYRLCTPRQTLPKEVDQNDREVFDSLFEGTKNAVYEEFRNLCRERESIPFDFVGNLYRSLSLWLTPNRMLNPFDHPELFYEALQRVIPWQLQEIDTNSLVG